MKHRAAMEGREMLNYLVDWMACWVFEAQKPHFETSKITIKQYTSGRESRVEELKWELAPTPSRAVVLKDRLK